MERLLNVAGLRELLKDIDDLSVDFGALKLVNLAQELILLCGLLVCFVDGDILFYSLTHMYICLFVLFIFLIWIHVVFID